MSEEKQEEIDENSMKMTEINIRKIQEDLRRKGSPNQAKSIKSDITESFDG